MEEKQPQVINAFDSFEKTVEELIKNIEDRKFHPGISKAKFSSIKELLAPERHL